MNGTDRVLVVDNDRTVRWVLEKALTDERYAVETAGDGKSALDMISRGKYSLVVMDVKMPVMDGITALTRIRELPEPPEVIVITAYSSMENTVEAMKLGAFDHVVKPFDIDEVVGLARRAVEKYRNRGEKATRRAPQSGDRIIGDSAPMRDLYKLLGRVASTSTSVLITGETGTGKDLFARAIHAHSSRRDGPFITVNCASIPGELLESELFGHERGAFTGATALRIGKCELADGGTLFLDEIGSMRLDLQAKLLTFLQRSEFERVGASRTMHVDVRGIAATNADLRDLSARGLFREDLYVRLMVVPIQLPPLRERREDIAALARYFVDRFNEKYSLNFQLSDDLVANLESRDWPGNVRELENHIHRMVVLQSDVFEMNEDVASNIPHGDPGGAVDDIVSVLLDEGSRDLLETAHELIEKPLLVKLLASVGENQSEAAKRLGVSRNTLRK
ncbi:MAG TPA: sigma-54 dependent transcriptional regulator, partial [Armatimonadota bacterium]|nr:sigma-54 dependent transcriptional regulator [Armatimonadota bacterium]